MSEATAVAEPEVQTQDTPAEANGSQSEGANLDPEIEEKGTPDAAATVHQDAEPAVVEDELRYSQKTLDAHLEAAREEAKQAGSQERDTAWRQQRQKLTQLVAESQGAQAAVIRSVRESLRNAGLGDEQAEPAIKALRDSRNVIEDVAFAIVGAEYKQAIDTALGAKSQAFWEKASQLDPTLDVAKIIPLLADELALSSKSLHDADPEDLLKANPKLRAHFEKYGDERYAGGRDQGRKDPKADATSEGRAMPQRDERALLADPNTPIETVREIRERQRSAQRIGA